MFWYNRGDCYLALSHLSGFRSVADVSASSQQQQALSDFNQALRLDPAHPPTKAKIASIHARQARELFNVRHMLRRDDVLQCAMMSTRKFDC
jgi:tetratricopeptide (TPR) repeat protein